MGNITDKNLFAGYCGSDGFPDFFHQTWNCPFWSDRPATPEDAVQYHL